MNENDFSGKCQLRRKSYQSYKCFDSIIANFRLKFSIQSAATFVVCLSITARHRELSCLLSCRSLLALRYDIVRFITSRATESIQTSEKKEIEFARRENIADRRDFGGKFEGWGNPLETPLVVTPHPTRLIDCKSHCEKASETTKV